MGRRAPRWVAVCHCFARSSATAALQHCLPCVKQVAHVAEKCGLQGRAVAASGKLGSQNLLLLRNLRLANELGPRTFAQFDFEPFPFLGDAVE